MRIETMGDPGAPAMLFIPGMLCTAESVRLFARHMRTEGFFILPTLSGHYADAPDYGSKEQEAAQLISWLQERGIRRLALLQGSSMGAEVAMEVLRQARGRIDVERCFFDGGPFFHFPWLFRRVMEGKFRQMAKILQYDTPEAAIAGLAKLPIIGGIIGRDGDKYLPMLRTMMTEKRTISAVTLRNITETCYNFRIPAFPEEVQRRMRFLYSDDEPAYMAARGVRKACPHAELHVVQGLGHCGWQSSRPEEYAAMLDAFIAADK